MVSIPNILRLREFSARCQASDPEYAWVTRHTWQSWRERYKKNATRLDVRIAEIVDQKKPAHGEKGQYGYVRKPEEKPKRVRKRGRKDSDVPGANANGGGGEASTSMVQEMDTFGVPVPVALPGVAGVLSAVGGPNDAFNGLIYSHGSTSVLPLVSQSTVANGRLDAAAARQSATEEEMEDDEVEWQIREGNSPPPPWAKRKTDDDEREFKRARTKSVAFTSCVDFHIDIWVSSGTPVSDARNERNGLHVVDQAIRDVAQETRFTIEEVQEFYDKCGDVERTRMRFRRMRETLNALGDDDMDQSK